MVINNHCRLAERCTKIRAILVRCVPPLARVEVPERRTGFQKSTGTPFHRVPAQFNHWTMGLCLVMSFRPRLYTQLATTQRNFEHNVTAF